MSAARVVSILLVAGALLGVAPRLALCQSTSVLSRDGKVVMVNKDVNGERWTITYDPERAYVSGNVLRPDGGADFLDCTITRDVQSAVDLSCYFADAGWTFIGNVTLSRTFLGNWPIGGNENPTPTPTPFPFPEPTSCLNIRGLRRLAGTGTVLDCFGGGPEVFIQQVGCRITGQFSDFGTTVRLEATIGDFGLIGGRLTVGNQRVLTVEGKGLTRQSICSNPTANSRFLSFDYFGGSDSGRGQIAIPLPGSASQAFLDAPVDLID